jgi:hypothetical protein
MYMDDFTKLTENDPVYVYYDIVLMLLLVSPLLLIVLNFSRPIRLVCVFYLE